MTKPLALASLAFATTFAIPVVALASGFETARFGGEHGTPVSPNPTGLYYNPAEIAQTTGTEVWIEAYLAFRSASYEHTMAKSDVPEPPGAQGANNGKGSLFNAAAVPMLAFTTKIKDFAFGAGFFVPFGGTESWNQNAKFANNKQYPGIVDGPQRWYSISGSIISLYFTAGAAYKIPGTGLSLGVSGNLINSSIDSLRAREVSGTDDITGEGRSLLDVKGFEGSFGAGLDYEAIKNKLWFGASYQARPNVAGGMKLNGTLKIASFGGETNQNVSVYQDYPDIIRWGGRFQPRPNIELRLFGDWERWSNFKNQCISAENTPCAVNLDGSAAKGDTVIQDLPRYWQDGYGVRAGASYWVKPTVELFVGTGYDSNAVPDQHLEPVIMDLKQITLAVGGSVDLSKSVRVGLSYTQFFGIPRDTTGESVNSTFLPPSTGPDAGGKYTQMVGLINANVQLLL